ncbi:diguanylate cyclase domain-containing protein [Marinobacter sp. Arc7-DN-1]|uniref:diguanylate cyclase domain-containing protein n=1 Tax=Marinobacter sp. Arc7-DN-1 TaxID=2304594 RepID=UPI000E4517B0|nr:diguanylate cyclase [Marinobacter sp. Arc7-DN-1]AXS83763.1 diguanylate cyclase [Marinobacter sp. Arc7-DN-1]
MLRYRDFFPLAADTQASAGLGRGIPLSDALPLGILVTDRDGKCLYSNTAYQKLCGWTGDELIGSHWSSVIHPQDLDKTLRHWDKAVLGHEAFLCEARLKCANGQVIWTRRNAALLTDGMPGHGYVHTVEGISTYKAHERARRQAEEQLFDEKERAQVTLDSIGDAVLSTDIDGRVSYMNVVAETLTGFGRHEAIGRPLSEIFHVVDANTHKPTSDPARRAILSDSIVALEANALLVARNGVELAIEDSAAPIHNRHGVVVGAVIVFHDARFSRETTARMAYLAQHDELTGLHNRNAFYERFDQSRALARRHGVQMGLLFIDLDNFKSVNDVLGHNSGDMILEVLAGKLKSCVRAADTVCRYGGDEFVVLLAEIAQPDHAYAVADKIREAAAEPMVIGGHEVSLQLSIGVSVYPDNGETADELLKLADRAMYRLKTLNRRPVAGSLIPVPTSLQRLL